MSLFSKGWGMQINDIYAEAIFDYERNASDNHLMPENYHLRTALLHQLVREFPHVAKNIKYRHVPAIKTLIAKFSQVDR